MNGILTQYMEENCSDICGKYLGEHICVGGNRYSKDTYTVRLNCTTGKHVSVIPNGTMVQHNYWFHG